MDYQSPTKNTLCNRGRYFTGNDKPASENGGVFWLADPNATGVQVVGGRAYLSSMLIYLEPDVADLWVMVFDAGNNVTAQQMSNPRIRIRVPQTELPATVVYECPESECDEVVYPNGSVKKVGKFFENGIRVFVSSTGDSLTPVASWGSIDSADIVTLSPGICTGGVV